MQGAPSRDTAQLVAGAEGHWWDMAAGEGVTLAKKMPAAARHRRKNAAGVVSPMSRARAKTLRSSCAPVGVTLAKQRAGAKMPRPMCQQQVCDATRLAATGLGAASAVAAGVLPTTS
jgi:hypothetical protein